MWFPAGTEWWLIRSTFEGVIQRLETFGKPTPESAPRFDQVLTIVGDSKSNGLRRLPSLYLGGVQVFTARDPNEVFEQTPPWVERMLRAKEVPTYMLNAFRLGDKLGLYGMDLCNRTKLRLSLARQGLEFANDPLVEHLGDGRFSCDDWGEFRPQVVLVPGEDSADPRKVLRISGAPFMFTMTTYKMGPTTPSELKRLNDLVPNLVALASKDAVAIAEEIER